ncbi:unnamed protein product [Auanema sp. JU1783]|nr:unnamed protein product [Auanema sp. JU1783]
MSTVRSTDYKREPAERIFVNRSLRLEKLKFFGFDMDYTLIQYKSPVLEELVFTLAVDFLIKMGYPPEIKKFEYNPIFPVRGLWFDYQFGNLLKVDGFGNILIGMHGQQFLSAAEIESQYPNKYLQLSESRIYVLNTLFNLPETHLIAQLIEYFDTHPDYEMLEDKSGLCGGDVVLYYRSIFQDCRKAIDWVHIESNMKEMIMNDPAKYVEKDPRAGPMFQQLRQHDKQTFLLTNSDWKYTNVMMTFLLGENWRNSFNLIVVDACKPKWFSNGTVFREVNTETGSHKLGLHNTTLKEGVVYSGGNSDAFHKLLNARGKDVLYVGDHIFGDVLRSKKARGWRTFLIIPELEHELTVWTDRRPLFEALDQTEKELSSIYKQLDACTTKKPDIGDIILKLRTLTNQMDEEYSVLGSLFRSGPRKTFFASQVERYADIYASSCYNLYHYPSFYSFRSPMQLLPHESTVDHTSVINSKRSDTLERQHSIGAKAVVF